MRTYDISRPPELINIGFDGENKWRPRGFSCTDWLQKHPDGIITLWVQPEGVKKAFPVSTTKVQNTIIWYPLSEELYPGTGKLQLTIQDGEFIGKSDTIKFEVNKSLVSGGAHPDSQPSWATKMVDDVTAQADRAVEAADRAEQASGEEVISEAIENYFEEHPVVIEETDPTVPAWAKQPQKPTYTAQEVGSLPVINVKTYGAKGDGTIDDTAAIAQAILAVVTGGTLYFPAGTYRVSNIALKSNMTVRGDGDASVIQLIDGLTGTTYQNCLTVNDVSNVVIHGLKLDGKRSTQSSTGSAQDQRLNGIHLKNASDVRIENVWLYNNGYHGIIGVNCARVQVCNCKSTDNGFRPIHFHSGCTDISIVENTCLNNGLGLAGGSGNLYDGIFVFGVERCVIAGNTVEANRAGCISASGTERTVGLSITGNTLICTAKLAPDTTIGTGSVGSCGVYLASSGLTNFVLSGNTIRNAYRGVFLYGDSSGSMEGGAIVGNSIDDCTIAFDVELNVNAVNISGNTITNALEKALATVRCKNLRFAENAIVFSVESQALTTTCINLYATDDCQVANNKVKMASHYRYGVRVYGTASGYTGAGNIIMDNVLNGAAVNAILFETDGNVQRSNWVNGVNDTPIPAEVTEQTVAIWGFTKNTGTYTKPSGGIPKSDLAEDVKASLGKADTALQTAPVTSVNNKTGAVMLGASDVGALPANTPIPAAVTEQTVAGWGFTKNTGTYSKPSGGIPKTDLAADVQTSLGKADTALQTAPVTSVNNKTGAVVLSASDVGALPSSTSIPTKVSDLTNDSNFQTAAQVQSAIAAAAELPSGGTTGDFLRKTASGVAWETVPTYTGGSY